MKTTPKLQISALIAGLILVFSLSAGAQTKGSGNLVKQERTVEPFTEIEAGSAFVISLTQGDPVKVIVETDDNFLENIVTTVEGNRLVIEGDKLRNPTAMRVYITTPDLSAIEIQGAARLDSEGEFKCNKLSIEASGASKVNLTLDAQEIQSEISGAAKVHLNGKAVSNAAEISGAALLDAMQLATQTTTAGISGAAKARVYAINELNAEISGAGTLYYFDNGETKKLNEAGDYTLHMQNPENPEPEQPDGSITTDAIGDSTLINIGDLQLQVIEGNPTKVKIGSNELEVDDDGNVKFKRNRRDRFDGHWGGLDMGINGYVNSDMKFDMPDGYKFLDLRMEKSINVALNLWEQNFNLIRNQFGLTTGLGFEWNNYRFDNNVWIDRDVNGIYQLENNTEGVSFYKSKLVVNYLTLPLMLEYQTNRFSKKNSFHIGGGILTGLRIGAHTKMVYDDGSKQKDKDHDTKGYDINPFKFDLMARIGWGKVNLYANYALNTLFKENQGPELYPFAVGITLAGW